VVFGVTIYEMLTSRPLLAGRSSADVIATILTVDATAVDVHAPHVPATLSGGQNSPSSNMPSARRGFTIASW
jgi:hypothetical protein